ncbi:MAG TPA: DUF934 domain-containing protein [Caulobacteraceae bacterium]|jgi:uncharacterized protein (DUF934 family)|nr:DUF934 domain-containing protein [Caulobacteraceae bacterium]
MPMLLSWRDGAAHAVEDAFTAVADDQPIPPGEVIVSLTRFEAEQPWLAAQDRALGVRLTSDADPEALAPWFGRLSLIAVEFPKFRDGRGYSLARLLRERYGWLGELRAVGDVLVEQSDHLLRCGFDAFEPADGTGAREWTAAALRHRHVYQRAADARVPAFVERAQG